MKKLLAFVLVLVLALPNIALGQDFTIEIGASPVELSGGNEDFNRALMQLLPKLKLKLSSFEESQSFSFFADNNEVLSLISEKDAYQILPMGRAYTGKLGTKIDIDGAENVHTSLYDLFKLAADKLPEELATQRGASNLEGTKRASARLVYTIDAANFDILKQALIEGLNAQKNIGETFMDYAYGLVSGLGYAKKIELTVALDENNMPYAYIIKGVVSLFGVETDIQRLLIANSNEGFSFYLKGSSKTESFNHSLNITGDIENLSLEGVFSVTPRSDRREKRLSISAKSQNGEYEASAVYSYTIPEATKKSSDTYQLNIVKGEKGYSGSLKYIAETVRPYNINARQEIDFPIKYTYGAEKTEINQIPIDKKSLSREERQQLSLEDNIFLAKALMSVASLVDSDVRQNFLHQLSSPLRYDAEDIPALKLD